MLIRFVLKIVPIGVSGIDEDSFHSGSGYALGEFQLVLSRIGEGSDIGLDLKRNPLVKGPREFRERSSFNGRQTAYGNMKYAVHSRGYQHPTNGEGNNLLPNPTKFMLDAFKGSQRSSKEFRHGPARKALFFEDASVESGSLLNKNTSASEELLIMGEPKVTEGQLGIRSDDKIMNDQSMDSQALDEANLMIDGGEIPDINDPMEEVVLADGDQQMVGEQEVGEVADTEIYQVENDGERAPKKKGAKGGGEGEISNGGTAKKHQVQTFISSRKKLLAKVALKVGDKGSKKACMKPKNPA
ncbi:unnamed protein product, partial [Eruca vesicaria subsp. sativa]|nr:unnamed protein product [Eruca vesicaria subsp. sativa]